MLANTKFHSGDISKHIVARWAAFKLFGHWTNIRTIRTICLTLRSMKANANTSNGNSRSNLIGIEHSIIHSNPLSHGRTNRHLTFQFSSVETTDWVRSFLYCKLRMDTARKRSRSDGWAHEKTLQFIELYRTHSHLWDTNHPDFRLSAAKLASVKQISEQLNVSRSQLTKKILQMRAKFKLYLNKTTLNPSATIVWPYFEEMKFLEKSYRVYRRKRAGNDLVGREIESRTRESQSENMDDDRDDCSSTSTQSIASSGNNAMRLESSSAAATRSGDSIDTFFLAMASIVKEFPRKNIFQLKIKFLQCISEMESTMDD